MAEYTPATPKYDIEVVLTGEDGNAWYIMGRVIDAMKKHGVSKEERDAYQRQAMDGDYDHLLWFTSCMVYVI